MIGLDVDGVLANWYYSMCLKYNMPYEFLLKWDTEWLTEKYFEVVKEPNFWENLKILNGPEEVQKVDHYITAIDPSIFPARKKWLIKNGYPDVPVHIAHKKAQICIDLGIKYFLDDKQQNCEEIRAAGITCYKYIPPYMMEKGTEWDVRSLEEFYLKVKKHEKEQYREEPKIQSIQGKMGIGTL